MENLRAETKYTYRYNLIIDKFQRIQQIFILELPQLRSVSRLGAPDAHDSLNRNKICVREHGPQQTRPDLRGINVYSDLWSRFYDRR